MKEKRKDYYENNKNKVKERNTAIFSCVCGCNITFGSKQKHQKTQKHIKLMESLSNNQHSVEILS
jgi:hypothetical protein